MFFFSILGICVEKAYISMRPWAQHCKNNRCANLFMILAVSLSVFLLQPAIVLFYRPDNVRQRLHHLLEYLFQMFKGVGCKKFVDMSRNIKESR